jgi:amino acid adenylation domain-containing protein
LPGLDVTSFALEKKSARFDLTLDLTETPDGLYGVFEYSTDLFESATIQRMAKHLQIILESIVEDLTQKSHLLAILTESERQQLLVSWNRTARSLPPITGLHTLFEEQVMRTPDALAASAAELQITYSELDRRSGLLAYRLRELGIIPDRPVALCMPRSLDLLIGLLAILKAGAPYLPLDPDYPTERIAYMLEDSQTTILLTATDTLLRLSYRPAHVLCLNGDWHPDAEEAAILPDSGVTLESLAYLIYTSGSTGQPKGVEIHHQAVVNFLCDLRERFVPRPGETWLATTTLSFDIAVLEIFLPLITGARLVLLPRELVTDGASLKQEIQRHAATVMQATPTGWRLLLESGWQGAPNLTLLCGGEALSVDLALRLRASGAALWNLYGPTETTIWSALHPVASDEVIPGESARLGRPLNNTQIYLLDPYFQPVPIGVPGEVYIGGLGLARGYHGQPALTAEKFVPHPFSQAGGERLYRTGDLARWLPDGSLQFLKRIDRQIKLRGYRIELSEIESCLRTLDEVRNTVVLLREDQPGLPQLVAYLVFQGGASLSLERVRAHLQQHLPHYMVPSVFLQLEALPLNGNGKVDRRRLPRPELPMHTEGYSAPRSEVERQLVAIWQSILQREQVGINDNFFDLGAHSLLFARAQQGIREVFAREISIIDLFQYPTVRSLAQYLTQNTTGQQDAAGSVEEPVETRDGSTAAQRRRLRRQRSEEENR